ncbi:MAG: PhoH family protein, partial [Oscillospiraceae bacterium]|nr:PhoH family protein [Oscillospiraceae bacterium]
MAEKLFEVLDNDIALAICGPFNTNISHMEKTLNSAIICRGTTFKVTGDDESVNNTISALTAMEDLYKRGTDLDEQAVRYCVSLAYENNGSKARELTGELVLLTSKGKPIRAKTLGQKEYLKAIEKNSITFGVGPAGTGKTYLAV